MDVLLSHIRVTSQVSEGTTTATIGVAAFSRSRICLSLAIGAIVSKRLLAVAIISTLASSVGLGDENDQSRLARDLKPLLTCLSGKMHEFQLAATIDAKIDGRSQHIDARLVRFSDDAFDLELSHEDYAVQLQRRAGTTAMTLPLHNVVFVGHGQIDTKDNLSPLKITKRLISSASDVAKYAPLLQSDNSESMALILTSLLKVSYDSSEASWKAEDDGSVKFSEEGRVLRIQRNDAVVDLRISSTVPSARSLDSWDAMRVVELDRSELERQLVRGVRRATEILAPSSRLTSPTPVAKKVKHGELRWIDGQRVALLHGTPEQIGKAHGELLKQEAMRCIDSVLYTFGTAQTIRTGRWFRHDLADAYARLSPHIPDRHKAEMSAMAASFGIKDNLAQTLNVFPELFHCSGFAVFGTATKDGKLYHGRVLDYMTTIGLQDVATIFVVVPQGQNAFANVGYAGFIGSVSGMNARGISLGEMGGRGEGQWDGVPMATLMRRALEECSTLEEVTNLWAKSARTCQYYYVFADGKTNQAVGVSATPNTIEFIRPGQGHELLGPGIQDAVVLSAGSRLEKLRERVTERLGTIDANVAQWLMSRPVAMQSNLHNVLFVPEDGILYVANASHDKPAAERPYVRLDLNELLKAVPGASTTNTVATITE